jgi:hypothetical protein
LGERVTQYTAKCTDHVIDSIRCEQVCDFVSQGANVFWIEEQQAPFAVHRDQWLSFDDDNSLRIKVTHSSVYLRSRASSVAQINTVTAVTTSFGKLRTLTSENKKSFNR